MRQSPLFSNIQTGEAFYDDVDCATYKGVTVKTFILLAISILVASFTAFMLPAILVNNPSTFYVTLVVSSLVGFISVIASFTISISVSSVISSFSQILSIEIAFFAFFKTSKISL